MFDEDCNTNAVEYSWTPVPEYGAVRGLLIAVQHHRCNDLYTVVASSSDVLVIHGIQVRQRKQRRNMSYNVPRRASNGNGGDGVDDDNASSVAESEDSEPRVVAPWAGRAGVKGYHRSKGSGAVRETMSDVQVRVNHSPYDFISMPISLQGEYRADGRVHTPSRVAPSVGHHQLP